MCTPLWHEAFEIHFRKHIPLLKIGNSEGGRQADSLLQTISKEQIQINAKQNLKGKNTVAGFLEIGFCFAIKAGAGASAPPYHRSTFALQCSPAHRRKSGSTRKHATKRFLPEDHTRPSRGRRRREETHQASLQARKWGVDSALTSKPPAELRGKCIRLAKQN